MMNSTDFFVEVAKARAVLERAADYTMLRGCGHELIGGATLTCASDVPWQIQVRCSRCALVFWFDNLAWREGGTDSWELSADSRENVTIPCAGAGIAVVQLLARTSGRKIAPV
jgi:hypothetical protein